MKKACAEPDGKAEKVAKHLTRKLDLNPQQRQEVQGMARDMLGDLCAMAPDHQAMKKALAQDLRADKSDTAALAAKWKQTESKFGELRGKMGMRYARLHALLNPEQRRKLADLMEKHGPHD